MSEVALYVAIAGVYALLGLVLSLVYYLVPRLREAPVVHALTLVVLGLAGLIATLGTSFEFESLATYHRGAQFFLFFGASLFYVPVIVYLLIHYWDLLLERLTSPGSREGAPRHRPRSHRQEWANIQACLEELAQDPTNTGAHERLGDLYAGLGLTDSAVYQYQKAADWLEAGLLQSQLLYKAARLLVDRKKAVPAALPLLRRLVRVYPKSYFASYARRVINQYEAHNPPPSGRAPAGQEPHEFFFPPGGE